MALLLSGNGIRVPFLPIINYFTFKFECFSRTIFLKMCFEIQQDQFLDNMVVEI